MVNATLGHLSRWNRVYLDSAYGSAFVREQLNIPIPSKDPEYLKTLANLNPFDYDPLYPSPEHLYLPAGFLSNEPDVRLINPNLVAKFRTIVGKLISGSYTAGIRLFLNTYLKKDLKSNQSQETQNYNELSRLSNVTLNKQIEPSDLPLHPEFYEAIYRSFINDVTSSPRPDNHLIVSGLWDCINNKKCDISTIVPQRLLKNGYHHPLKIIPKLDPSIILIDPLTANKVLFQFARVNDVNSFLKLKETIMNTSTYLSNSKEAILSNVLFNSYLDTVLDINNINDIDKFDKINKEDIITKLWNQINDINYNEDIFISKDEILNEILLGLSSTPFSLMRKLIPNFNNIIQDKELILNLNLDNQKISRFLSRFEILIKDISITLFERVLCKPDIVPNVNSFELIIYIILNLKGGMNKLGDLQLSIELFKLLSTRFQRMGVTRTNKILDMIINEALCHEEYKLANELVETYNIDIKNRSISSYTNTGLDLIRSMKDLNILNPKYPVIPSKKHTKIHINGCP